MDPAAVSIYRTAEQVPAKYTEVALLNSMGESSWTNEKQMYESMKREAAKLGANGVILDAMSEPSAGTKVAAAFLRSPPACSDPREKQPLASRS